MIDDDEFADQILDQVDDEPSSSPALEDWSPDAPFLATMVDRMGEMVAAFIASKGGKSPTVKPTPRPKTALDRARSRRSVDRHLSLVAEVEEARVRRQALSD